MARVAIALAGLLACGQDRPPASPLTGRAPAPGAPHHEPPPSLEALSSDARCEAVAPRTTACMREILIASASLIDPEIGRDMAAEIDRKGFRDGEARALHDSQCRASRADSYAASVVTCWAQPTCDAFAACVNAAEGEAAAAMPPPTVDP